MNFNIYSNKKDELNLFYDEKINKIILKDGHFKRVINIKQANNFNK